MTGPDREPAGDPADEPAVSPPAGAAPLTAYADPDAVPTFEIRHEDDLPARSDQQDWKWVEQWRAGGEPTPWGPGLALAGFAALLIGAAVYVIGYGLSDRPVLAVAANVIVAAGLAPALWMSRALPVLRWIALGSAVGTVIAWLCLLFVQRTAPV